MFVYYENTVLNKLIVTFVKPFCSLEEERLTSYEKFEDLDLLKIIDKSPHEELTVISSSFIPMDVIESKLQDVDFLLKIRFIIKGAEDVEAESYCVFNWYIYWANILNAVQEQDVDKEIIDNVYQYFHKFPTLSQRRIVEYLNSILSLPRSRFLEILKNETLSMVLTKGKNYIEQRHQEFIRDKNNSTTKVIKDIRCAMCISSYIETAFQILDKLNVDVVMLFEINLKTSSVDVTLVPRDGSKIPFSHLIKYRNGLMSMFRITFREFVDYLNL